MVSSFSTSQVLGKGWKQTVKRCKKPQVKKTRVQFREIHRRRKGAETTWRVAASLALAPHWVEGRCVLLWTVGMECRGPCTQALYCPRIGDLSSRPLLGLADSWPLRPAVDAVRGPRWCAMVYGRLSGGTSSAGIPDT